MRIKCLVTYNEIVNFPATVHRRAHLKVTLRVALQPVALLHRRMWVGELANVGQTCLRIHPLIKIRSDYLLDLQKFRYYFIIKYLLLMSRVTRCRL